MQHHSPSVAQRVTARRQVAPFPGECQENAVRHAIQHERPEKREVQRHALGQAVIDVQSGIHGIGEKMQECVLPQADPVHVVGPVDQQAAPQHERQERQIQPMHPTHRPGVLADQADVARQGHPSSLAPRAPVRR